jgi:hypothetical protein
MTSPVGYIEIKNGQTKFRQIMDSTALISLVIASSLVALTVFWGIGKLVRDANEKKS